LIDRFTAALIKEAQFAPQLGIGFQGP